MSEQILLQGKILGLESFLLAPPGGGESTGEELPTGRAYWVTLLAEVLPRALLAELGLAPILLGASGGRQFLVVLPEETRPAASEFLSAAAREMERLSDGAVRLLWAATENLGDWPVVRKRLSEALERGEGCPLHGRPSRAFQPFAPGGPAETDGYFSRELGARIRDAATVGWSPETPGQVWPGAGKHSWRLTPNVSVDGITIARHAAPADDAGGAADLATLARRASGRPVWGVLRGDVDNFSIRLRRLQGIEEHVPLSVLYKQFFAGELEVLCSLPEFWRKVTILYSGGADFAVYGSWDALIPLAAEMQRLFHRFSEENLKDFPGPEGKTISMALALEPAGGAALAMVYEEAGRNLAIAKAADKDCIYVLGRVLEWKHLTASADLKDVVARMAREIGAPGELLRELRGLYGKASGGPAGKPLVERVWRFHRRLNLILGAGREKEFQKLKTHLAGEMAGRRTAQVKLRPSGLVALEWARLLTEVDDGERA
ncbi:MAG: Cas10/Cmr2 second palm domain-containing protein [Bryobacteraceae bacterium]